MQYVRTVPEFQFFSQNEFPGDFITFNEVFNELFVENMLAELRRFEELWGSLGLLFCYQTILSRHEHSSCGSNVGVSKNCSYNFKTPYRLTSRYDLYDLQTFEYLQKTHFTNTVIYSLIANLLASSIRNKETYEYWDDMFTNQTANTYIKGAL